MPWRGGQLSTENGANFVTNQATIADVSDYLARRSGNVVGLSATWACVNLLAGTISSLPLMVYRTTDGVRSVARGHPLYYVLHDSPNFDQSAVDFWEYVVAAIELQGNAYAEIEKRADGSVYSLTPIRPDAVTVRRLSSGVLEYSWSDAGERQVRGARDVLHIRGPLGDALSGVSTLTACRATFDAAASANEAADTMFRNGVRSSGVFSADGAKPLTPEQMRDAQALIEEKYVGAMNAGRPMLLNGLKFQALSMSADDAQMIENRRLSVEEICRVFGVPPHMVGHTENSTSWGTGLEQQTLGFVKFSLRRRLKRIEQALMKQLLTARDRADGITIEFNLEGLLRGDSNGRASFYQSGLTNGWMTINEVRALENMPPVAGGDTPRMQSQNVPISGPRTVSDSQSEDEQV